MLGKESINSIEHLADSPGLISVNNIEVLDRQLGPEVAIKAQRAAGVLLGMFDKQGLKPGDIGLVTVGDKVVVMDTAYAGLSYRGRGGDWGDPEDFAVEFDDKMCDTRTGMTSKVYGAFIAGAQLRGVEPLPDSQTEGGGGLVHPGTWLTGEEDDYIPEEALGIIGNAYNSFGCVADGGACIESASGHSSLLLRQVLFRPSLVITIPSTALPSGEPMPTMQP